MRAFVIDIPYLCCSGTQPHSADLAIMNLPNKYTFGACTNSFYNSIVLTSSLPMSDAREGEGISKEKERQLKAFLRRAVEQRKELEAEVARLTQQIEEKDLRIQMLEPIVNDATKEQQELQNTIQSLQTTIDTLKTSSTPSGEELEALKRENTEIKEKLNASEKNVEKMKGELEKLKARCLEAESVREDIEKRFVSVQSESALIQSDMSLQYQKLQKDYEELKSSSQTAAVDVLELQQKLADAEAEIQKYKTQGGKLKSFLKGLQQENNNLKLIEIDQEKSLAEMEALKQALLEKDEVIVKLRSEIAAIKDTTAASGEEKAVLEKEVSQLKASLRKAQRRLKEKKQQLTEMERLVQSERAKAEQTCQQLDKHHSQVEQLDIALARAESEVQENLIELEELRRRDRDHVNEVLQITKEKQELAATLRDIDLRRREIVLTESLPLRFEMAYLKVKKEKPEQLPVSLRYLQKVFLEFVSKDEKTQTTLLPILLNCVGCDELQIQVATKSWAHIHKRKKFGLF